MSNYSLFGLTHLLTLCCVALVFVGLHISYNKGAESTRKTITRTLAVCCLVSYPVNQLLAQLSQTTQNLESLIPFHLCDLAALVCGAALLSESQRLRELAYFWGLAATLQGLITPNIADNYPLPLYVAFFWTHGFIVISALFLPLSLGLRPHRSAIWRVFLITNAYACGAMIVNSLIGTNFAFLSSKPTTASLLDYLPVWPWYIVCLQAICLALLWLLYLPFSVKSAK